MENKPHSLKDALHFLSRFISKPHSVGSIWPSSQKLGAAMIQGFSIKPGDVIIEYGPGTGPFTQLLRPYLAQGVKYLGIEHDQILCKGLQRKFPEMNFHHGSAEETPDLLQYYKLSPACLIISGLPFANMPPQLQKKILSATQKSLRPDGHFRTFTYLLSSLSPRSNHFHRIAHDYFSHYHGSRTVMCNFPPARVLDYSHPKVNSSFESAELK